MERDRWMTSDEALKYGIVDKVISDISVPQKAA
jgi:ATP-dependent protease ClpP protease subunit